MGRIGKRRGESMLLLLSRHEIGGLMLNIVIQVLTHRWYSILHSLSSSSSLTSDRKTHTEQNVVISLGCVVGLKSVISFGQQTLLGSASRP